MEIIKKNVVAYSRWYGENRHRTEYWVRLNGRTSYFGCIDNDAVHTYDPNSRHQMAVQLAYLHKTGYRYVDRNIPSSYQPGCSLEERFDFIRKGGYTPDKTIGVTLYWDDHINAWGFIGNLHEYSYAWNFYIYDRSVVEYILREMQTLNGWENVNVKL